jgi:energy-coupling factor transporter transmembrane protein EcfT
MKSSWKSEVWVRLLCVLCLLLPLVILFLLPGGEMIGGIGWFWLVLLLCFVMSWMMLGRPRSDEEPVRSCHLHAEKPEFRTLAVDELPRGVSRHHAGALCDRE